VALDHASQHRRRRGRDRPGGPRPVHDPAAEGLLGWTQEEAAGQLLSGILRILGAGSDGGSPDDLGAFFEPGRLACTRLDCLIATRDGSERLVTVNSAPILDRDRHVSDRARPADITAQRAAEQELVRSREELKIHVTEVHERNTALKVLLAQREYDRGEFEERIMENVRTLILPYLEKLKAQRLAAQEEAFLNIVETNLLQITSTFSRRLSSRFHGLSPQEIRIANLVKEGRQDKEIMETLNISFETVKTHRQNIRKKLGIYGKRGSLRMHLSHYSD